MNRLFVGSVPVNLSSRVITLPALSVSTIEITPQTNDVTGQTVSGTVALDGFVGTTRVVTFTATDHASFTNHVAQTLSFSGGTASYTLPVPMGTISVSAKTAWNLRREITVTFPGAQATVNFTGLKALPAGDLDQ